MLDRSPTYRRHLESLRKKLTHASHSWGCLLALVGVLEQNVANSHLSSGPFVSRALRSCLMPQCSHPPHWLCHQWCLANCDWTPASYTSGQPSYPRRHQTFWAFVAMGPHCAMEPGHLSAEWECTASQIETPVYPPRNNSSVHLTTTTTDVRRSGRISIGMQSG